MTKRAMFTALSKVDISRLCNAMTRLGEKAWIADGRIAGRGHSTYWASQRHGCRQYARHGQPHDHPD